MRRRSGFSKDFRYSFGRIERPRQPFSPMILATHAIVGGAIASLMPSHPAAAFALGFASHFALDALPHWDYPIRSPSIDPTIAAPLRFDRALLRDAIAIGSDGFGGLLAAFLLFATPTTQWAIMLGAFGALFPDALQFLYTRFPREPLRSVQRFHVWIHTERKINESLLLGVGSQALFVAAVIAITLVAQDGRLFATTLAAPAAVAP